MGEFSTKKREEDVAYATKETLKKLREKEDKDSIIVIEWVRCIEEIDYLRKEMESVLTLFIELPFEERARRMVERNREGEETKEVMKKEIKEN